MINLVTGLGTNRDKRIYGRFAPEIIADVDARDMWRANGIAARLVELVPKAMFREGFEVKLEDKEQSEDLHAFLEDLGAVAKLKRAKEYERAFGGGVLWPMINDGVGDLALPLNEERIVSFEKISRPIEPRELQPWTWDEDGEPEVWLFSPIAGRRQGGQFLIHDSRLIRFCGHQVSHEHQYGTREGFGDSMFTLVLSALRDLAQSTGSAASLITDFSQAVVKMKDLAQVMSQEGGETLVKSRLEVMDLMRSVMKAIPIDAEDDFIRTPTPMSGLADTLDRFMVYLSANTGFPVTILMGRSPAGLNATGDADTRSWYDLVAEEQHESDPQVERLIRLAILAKNGPIGAEPEVWSYEWKPLWQPSGKEVAEERKLIAETDKIYVESGVVSPEEIAMSRFGGDTYSPETAIDFDARDREEPAASPPAKTEQQIEEEEAERAQMEAALNGAKTEDKEPEEPTE